MTPPKPTLTLNLSTKEAEALTNMATAKDMSKTAVIRQALRAYQLMDSRLKQGEQMCFRKADGSIVELVVVGCGDPL